MLTRKPCKWCGSVWHSKNKCEKREISPFKPVYSKKRTNSPLSPQSPSDGLRTRQEAIKEADRVFGAYIRSLSRTCYSCKRTYPHDLQCGHFMSRRYIKTRWSELNCHPQCNECNVEKHGNLEAYEMWLRADYGDETIDMLKMAAIKGGKVSLMEIENVITEYKSLVF